MAEVPALRLSLASGSPVNEQGAFVLYWMTAARRVTWNYALDRAVDWAQRLGRPLIILEDLRLSDRWANDRLHRFAIDGMAENAARLRGRPVLYYPYVEPAAGDGDDLLPELARQAAVVVTDDFPCGPWPALLERTAARLPVRVEKIDSNGLLPLAAADRVYPTARGFRGFLQRNLAEHLEHPPQAEPLARVKLPVLRWLPTEIARRWPAAGAAMFAGGSAALGRLPMDHSVPPSETHGGSHAAVAALRQFVSERLARYTADRNHPDEEATSGLAPYLHFGHISAHQVYEAVAEAANSAFVPRGGSPYPPRTGPGCSSRWVRGPAALSVGAAGQDALADKPPVAPGRDLLADALADKPPVAPDLAGRGGAADPNADAFLDQLVTWREVGYNFCAGRPDYDRYESLPAWARRTLAAHRRDRREYRYSATELEAAGTHDELWNAAQRQLVREGRLHNYLRMLWGKKVLEWSASPEEAVETLIHLNNKYALDGCNPNSYSGIFWVFGRYDRAWGPERPVFGTIRYMSSANTRRKLRVLKYMERFAR
jgi:deoxyribodipyrimidine photo-lyase